MSISKRCFYVESIADFLKTDDTKVISYLTTSHLKSFKNLSDTQNRAWSEEIDIMKKALQKIDKDGIIHFEYNIPRMGRRIDVVLLIDGVVFVLEFKAFREGFSKLDIIQVYDYALDLKNFHAESHSRYVVPILVNTEAASSKNQIKCFSDRLFLPLLANSEDIADLISQILKSFKYNKREHLSDDNSWTLSSYSPTPTIVEAASALYLDHTVEEISRNDAGAINLSVTSDFVSKVIEYSKKKKRKSICFVTGVPGAGKTLVGLNIATDQFKKNEVATYLSGNFPLVEVLTEALTRNKVLREKENGNKMTKTKARSEVKTFIQMVHHYRDTCLEGAKISDGEIVIDQEYFVHNSEKSFVPIDHVAIFDEAQRAWTQEQLANFMSRKKGIAGFPYSEPEFLISCLDRHDDWAVVICLVGGGQEINTGEAGITEWIESLNRKYLHWDVYISDQLTEQEYGSGKVIELLQNRKNVNIEQKLHLSVSMRSFRAENVSNFIHHLLEKNAAKSRELLSTLDKFEIYVTRDLHQAKEWLRSKARGSERYGIVASSSGERLRPENISVRLKADVVHWFLDDETDVRSSLFLEDVATEFDVQGLELDWCCVAWDGDFRSEGDDWGYYQFNGGTKWNNVLREERKSYRKNAYRVLLTRARQGMVIFVPKGNPRDLTRVPEIYDSTYNYLRNVIGVNELPSFEEN